MAVTRTGNAPLKPAPQRASTTSSTATGTTPARTAPPAAPPLAPDAPPTPLAPIDPHAAEALQQRNETSAASPPEKRGLLGFLAKKQESAKAENGQQAWFSTDWFVGGKSGTADGDPQHNLWATGGPLDKLDAVDRAQGGAATAQRGEKYTATQIFAGLDKHFSQEALLSTDTLTETGFGRDPRRQAELYRQAFGVDGAVLPVPVSAFDFMAADGRPIRPPAGSRIAAVLDGQPLQHQVDTSRQPPVVNLLRDGKELSAVEQNRVYFAFVDSLDRPLGDGHPIQKYDYSWWGNCDKASLAALAFERPKHDVTMQGKDSNGQPVDVKFTPRDIEGLLTVVARELESVPMDFSGTRYDKYQDTIVLNSGEEVHGEVAISTPALRRAKQVATKGPGDWRLVEKPERDRVGIELPDGQYRQIPADQIKAMYVQNFEDIKPWQLRDKVMEMCRQGGGASDIDSLARVYNRPFTSAENTVLGEQPAWDERGPQQDPKLRREWGELTVNFADQPRTYRYWIDYDGDRPTDGGYREGPRGETPPDFIWAPSDRSKLRWPEKLSHTPWADVALIKRLYQRSIDRD